jgi:TonB family protein
MRKLVTFAVLVLCTAHPAFAARDSDQALQERMVFALQNLDFQRFQTSPIRLDVDFVAQFDNPLPGHLTLSWQAKDRWRRDVILGKFREIEIRNGDWRYINRNASFTPYRVIQLENLLNLDTSDGSWLASKEKRRVVNGVPEDCIKADSIGDSLTSLKQPSREICLVPDSNDILSETTKDDSDGSREKIFGDYSVFSGHRYPRTLQLELNGVKIVTATITSVAAATFDESIFKPLPNAIARRACDDMRAPVLLKFPQMNFSPAARPKGGAVSVTMTVDLDGSVSDVQMSGTSGIPLDADTLKSLQSYKFKPAMCGTVPVVADVTVEVDFKMYN